MYGLLKMQPEPQSELFKLENTLREKIYDNIHGFIYLTKEEKDLLSSPYFQRLHFIKQNALANFVFPGATHTRFAHSIGVLYIAEKIIQRLKKLKRIKINPIDHQVIRLAALLHDIGHYPLSHTIESSYTEYARITKPQILSKEENIVDKFRSGDLKLIEFLGKLEDDKSFYNHEKIAQKIITSETPLRVEVKVILRKVLSKQENIAEEFINQDEINGYANLIGEVITGKLDYTGNYVLNSSEENEEKYYILSQIINSSLDADQMDYMCRDTENTGIKATIRLDFLIDNIDICLKKLGKGVLKPVLCFKMKALQSLEQFLLAKFYWYSEILYYDKIHILNLIAKRLNIFMLLASPEKYYYTAEYFFFNSSTVKGLFSLK